MYRDTSSDVAVVGLAARFPGPEDLHGWWKAVVNGEVLTTRLNRADALSRGIPEHHLDNDWVPVLGDLPSADRFDFDFFKMSPREAELLDPQHRHALEVAWKALEDAGANPNAEDQKRTAVFASSTGSSYMRRFLTTSDVDHATLDDLIHGCEPEFLASRVAYKLGLRGPAMAVQTACSSSLVGVHLAVQALVNGDCDQAVVIGTSIGFPRGGYQYQPGGVLSPSGLCRPFSSNADGVIGGHGAAAVVLRRLEDVDPGDVRPYGVVLGTAVNNDGASKAGYYAPSPDGQSRVIRSALVAADIHGSTVGYLQTHGTGTPLGDPIEWAAASAAYGAAGAGNQQIAIGAVKANIGHLDACAGLAGLITTLFTLNTGQIPPLAGFSVPNTALDLTESPLRVPQSREAWAGPTPRRAGVSAFGIGGTNAHVILENFYSDAAEFTDRPVILGFSAKDPESRDRYVADVCASSAWDEVGVEAGARALTSRPILNSRYAAVVSNSPDVQHLGSSMMAGHTSTNVPASGRPVILVFPGQGTQTPGMALPYCKVLPGFRDHLDRLIETIRAQNKHLAAAVASAVFDPESDPDALDQTEIAQPAIVCLQLSLSAVLHQLGIRPIAVVGHSLGEIAAASVAGVISDEEAVRFSMARGAAMQDCPNGAMLSLRCNEQQAAALIRDTLLDLAAVNAAEMSVVSGTSQDIQNFSASLAPEIHHRRLRTTRAFHSRLIQPAIDALRHASGQFKPRPSQVYLGCSSEARMLYPGATPGEDFWVKAAVRPVQFRATLEAALRISPDAVVMETGPGRPLAPALAELASHSASLAPDSPISLLDGLASAWAQGAPIDLSELLEPTPASRLPTYPFRGPEVIARELRPQASVIDTVATDAQGIAKATAIISTDPEAILRTAWESLLGISNFTLDSDFFELGGDSLMMIRLIRLLRQSLGTDIPLGEFTIASTFRSQLGVALRSLESSTSSG